MILMRLSYKIENSSTEVRCANCRRKWDR